MNFVEPIRDKEKIEIVKRILRENGSRDYLLFLMGINSGLRISDILKLKVLDVKDKKYIELIEQKTSKYKRFPITKSFKKELDAFIVGKDNTRNTNLKMCSVKNDINLNLFKFNT